MRTTQLREVDLNLLVVFSTLARERSISSAAEHLLLSQPAVSRSFQRLQHMFGDQLMVRGRDGYALTSNGQRILNEIDIILPRLSQLLKGRKFDPEVENANFKIAGTDYAFSVLGSTIAKKLLMSYDKISLEFSSWSDTVYEDIEQGRSDIAIIGDHGNSAPHLKTEALFEDRFVCVVTKASKYRTRLNLKSYAAADHVIVSLLGREQFILDRPLGKLGVKRQARLRVGQFSSAVEAVEGTDLIATIPAKLAQSYFIHQKNNSHIRLIEAPREIQSFQMVMLWHPRLDTDSANEWLRAQLRAEAMTL